MTLPALPAPKNEPPLDLLQRWMMAVMTHPGGIVAGVESDIARQSIDVPLQQLDQMILPSARCTSVERLAVYGNAYFARLLECLEAEFPAVQLAVGRDAFYAFVQGYLQTYPSSSYTLNMLGARFPEYLAETRPAATEPDPWSTFVVELAQLERLYADVFDGPGEEELSPFSTTSLETTPPDQWGKLRLAPSPSLRLCRSQFPVHEAVTAARRGESVHCEPRPTWLVVSRRDYVVRREAVSELQWTLLQELQSGRTIEEAIERALERSMASIEDLAQGLHAWFRHWAAAGYFREVIPASLSS